MVSVLVPTKNSAEYLGDCLRSLVAQTYQNIEIIVIDNFSTDKTVEIAQSFGAKVYQIGPERCTQLNYGASKASGKYLYRVDSDFVVMPTVIEECVRLCEEHQYGAIAVPNLSTGSGFWARVRKLERDTYVGDSLIVAVRFIRKSDFDAVGGFDESLVAAEDYDLHNRVVAGATWAECSACEEHLGEPKSLREIARKSYYYGTTMGMYLRKHPVRGTTQLNPFRPSYFRHWRTFMKSPVLTGGFVIMKFVQYGFGGLGLLRSLILSNDRR